MIQQKRKYSSMQVIVVIFVFFSICVLGYVAMNYNTEARSQASGSWCSRVCSSDGYANRSTPISKCLDVCRNVENKTASCGELSQLLQIGGKKAGNFMLECGLHTSGSSVLSCIKQCKGDDACSQKCVAASKNRSNQGAVNPAAAACVSKCNGNQACLSTCYKNAMRGSGAGNGDE